MNKGSLERLQGSAKPQTSARSLSPLAAHAPNGALSPRSLQPPSPEDYSPHQLDAAERDMQVALDGYPALTPPGFHIDPRPMAIPRSVEWFGPVDAVISRESKMFEFWRSRMAMRTEEALAAFIACRAWLRVNAVRRKSLNKQLDSEKIRNVAAQHIGGLSHGVLIAALELEGFIVKQTIDPFGQPTANAWTNARPLAAAYKLRGSP
jgi:hypothetical protein